MIDDKFRSQVWEDYKRICPAEYSSIHHLVMLYESLGHMTTAARGKQRAAVDEFRSILKAQSSDDVIATDAWKAHWYPVWYEKYIAGTLEDYAAEAVLRYLIMLSHEKEPFVAEGKMKMDKTSTITEDIFVLYSYAEMTDFMAAMKGFANKYGFSKDLEYIVRSRVRYLSLNGTTENVW